MTYAEIAERLGVQRVCFGGCGLGDYAHRGRLFLGVIHWRERRMTRRGLRRFLLLVARRMREADPDFLNTRGMAWAHAYFDEQFANQLAAQLRIRFPAVFSAVERERCHRGAPVGYWRTHQAIWAWATQL